MNEESYLDSNQIFWITDCKSSNNKTCNITEEKLSFKGILQQSVCRLIYTKCRYHLVSFLHILSFIAIEAQTLLIHAFNCTDISVKPNIN